MLLFSAVSKFGSNPGSFSIRGGRGRSSTWTPAVVGEVSRKVAPPFLFAFAGNVGGRFRRRHVAVPPKTLTQFAVGRISAKLRESGSRGTLRRRSAGFARAFCAILSPRNRGGIARGVAGVAGGGGLPFLRCRTERTREDSGTRAKLGGTPLGHGGRRTHTAAADMHTHAHPHSHTCTRARSHMSRTYSGGERTGAGDVATPLNGQKKKRKKKKRTHLAPRAAPPVVLLLGSPLRRGGA